MQDNIFKTPKGELYYTIKDNSVTVTSYSGDDEVLEIPETIEDAKVRAIDKKAFMNTRSLRRVVLPDNIKKLSDWCFSYCKMLTEVEIPKRTLAMGRSPFLGDSKLVKIMPRSRKDYPDKKFISMNDKEKEDTARLLACAVNLKEADFLLNIKEAGRDAWFKGFDQKIISFIEEDDEEGHTELILCGEEDIDCTLESFIRNKRKEKVRLAFLRLLYNTGIEEKTENQLKDYLRDHSVGCDSDESWQVLKEEFGHEKKYYELYVEIGCLNDENFYDTLNDLGDKHPEMKAVFIRWNEQNKPAETDFFDQFEL